MGRCIAIAAVMLGVSGGAVMGQNELPAPAEPIEASALVGGMYVNVAEVALIELKMARKAMADSDWKAAVQALQAVLESPAKSLVKLSRKGEDGKKTMSWVGAHTEASRLLAQLPKPGVDAYEKRYGAEARRLLGKAKKHDTSALGEVVDRYRFTAAGAEALAQLAELYFTEGRFHQAAHCYALWREHRFARPPNDLQLYQMTLAFRRADSPERAEKAWKELAAKVADRKLRIGDEQLTLAQARQRLERKAPLPAPRLTTWDRKARAGGGLPAAAKPLWKRPLLLDEFDGGRGKEAQAWVDTASKATRGAWTPGFCPLALDNLCIYRRYLDLVAAFARASGKERAGEWVWLTTRSNGGLGRILAEKEMAAQLDAFWKEWQQLKTVDWVIQRPHGGLSTDGATVYLVDDLAVPPPPALFRANFLGARRLDGDLKALVWKNALCAFDLATEGKLTFALGLGLGLAGEKELAHGHFLAAPLPLDRRLYLTHEQHDGEIRLLTINPETAGAVDATRSLGITQPHRRYVIDSRRRLSGACIVAGEGVLVCPTHAGTLLGVDLLTQRILWAYGYHQEKAPVDARGQPMVASDNVKVEWKAAVPIITGDKLVFTAPEEGSVHCLNVRDGTPLWKVAKKESDVYLAGVFGDKVLLVGQTGCRALSLAKGEEIWRVTAGIPSGVGAASDGVYYLPLRSGSKSTKPEVCAIDMQKGTVTGRVELSDIPGNLVFNNGLMLSQSATSIAAYRLK